MSNKHPIIVVTGSSGAGTTTVESTFDGIFKRKKLKACHVSGDSFHRHNRTQFEQAVKAEAKKGNHHFSHFGPDSNDFKELENLFETYGKAGKGRFRHYIHSETEAKDYSDQFKTDLKSGEFTPYKTIPENTDLLFYEGLHGMFKNDEFNLPKHVDFALGVVPVVNLEWTQKIHRDRTARGYTKEQVIETILRRMPDYVNHVTPQFSLTDINFQRVSTVDTSNPFVARDIPTLDESFVVIRFRRPSKFNINFPYLMSMIHDSFMSRSNTLVVPGGKMGMAMEIIVQPIIESLQRRRN